MHIHIFYMLALWAVAAKSLGTSVDIPIPLNKDIASAIFPAFVPKYFKKEDTTNLPTCGQGNHLCYDTKKTFSLKLINVNVGDTNTQLVVIGDPEKKNEVRTFTFHSEASDLASNKIHKNPTTHKIDEVDIPMNFFVTEAKLGVPAKEDEAVQECKTESSNCWAASKSFSLELKKVNVGSVYTQLEVTGGQNNKIESRIFTFHGEATDLGKNKLKKDTSTNEVNEENIPMKFLVTAAKLGLPVKDDDIVVECNSMLTNCWAASGSSSSYTLELKNVEVGPINTHLVVTGTLNEAKKERTFTFTDESTDLNKNKLKKDSTHKVNVDNIEMEFLVTGVKLNVTPDKVDDIITCPTKSDNCWAATEYVPAYSLELRNVNVGTTNTQLMVTGTPESQNKKFTFHNAPTDLDNDKIEKGPGNNIINEANIPMNFLVTAANLGVHADEVVLRCASKSDNCWTASDRLKVNINIPATSEKVTIILSDDTSANKLTATFNPSPCHASLMDISVMVLGVVFTYIF